MNSIFDCRRAVVILLGLMATYGNPNRAWMRPRRTRERLSNPRRGHHATPKPNQRTGCGFFNGGGSQGARFGGTHAPPGEVAQQLRPVLPAVVVAPKAIASAKTAVGLTPP